MASITTLHPTESAGRSTAFARILPHIVRILMGASLIVFGLNLFLNFLPQPTTPLPPAALAFIGALAGTGYMLKMIGATQVIVGILLLANRFVPLALILFAPFLVNSLAFHIFLEPSGRPMAVLYWAFELYLAWVNRRAYAPLFRASPDRIERN